MNKMAKFSYRDFYDVPRMMILNHNGRKILLDCEFLDSEDEYSSMYKVYILPPDIDEDREESWESMPARSIRYIGEIPVQRFVFDRTKRAALDMCVIADLLDKSGAAR
jgi:hypothetical protein